MVLRKPYKFLIKHFKFIHLILAVISVYLLVKTNGILNFFNGYLNNSETIIGTGTVNEYFNGLMTLFIFIILIGTLIISVIMKMKDKPILVYIINMIIFIFVSVIFVYDKSLIETLELRAIDVRTLKLASDLTLICFLTQTFSTIVLTIRAVGFDLKKFDFGKDMEFEIDEKDNEEFEFEVAIDKNKIKRNVKKNIRNLKYTYHENKFLANSIILIVLIGIGIGIYMNLEVFNKVYKKGEMIMTPQFTYTLVDSYLVDKDYRNNKITNNYLVVAKLKIKNNTKDKITLETARILLNIGKVRYNPTVKYKDKLIDLGVDIDKKNIKNDFEEYIVAFEIPKNDIDKKMILSYNDLNNNTHRIKLNNIKFSDKKEVTKAYLTENMTIENDIIKKVEFKISDFVIDNKIKVIYNFCETKNVCYDSYEYVAPSLTDNYDKAIMKIESQMNFNGQTIKNFDNISDFIENYGTITYKINNQVKEMKTKIKEIPTNKSNTNGIYYFEVYKEIKEATEVSLKLNIRNEVYEYKIK